MTDKKFYPEDSARFAVVIEKLKGQKVAVLGHQRPDGDCIGSTDPWSHRSAHTGHTLMAYRDPPGNVRTFFTELDILALQKIWGRD